ncbi:MAG: FeoB-associated Cys-rich membrane protein [Bacteroidetes bacterium]|nr:FeoB-associated Cys-rich membrane protein [Bacteroidota bacterium]
MNIQQIAVYLIFAGAIFYLAYRNFNAYRKKQCSKGCAGGCNSVDISKIDIK